MEMIYAGDERVLSMAEIEQILTYLYGESDYDREAGCYSNGNWFSVNNILRELSYNAMEIVD